MKKTNSSVIGCIFSFILYCVVLSWMITFRDFYSFIKCIFQTIFQFSNNALLQCFGRAHVDFATSNSSKSSTLKETCTKNIKNVENEGSFVVSKEGIEVVMGILGMSNEGEIGEINIGSMDIIALFEEEGPRMDELKEAFDVFDENGDGFIDAKELKRVIGNLGFKEASEEECQMKINTFDFDGDELINIDEFEKLLENSFSS